MTTPLERLSPPALGEDLAKAYAILSDLAEQPVPQEANWASVEAVGESLVLAIQQQAIDVRRPLLSVEIADGRLTLAAGREMVDCTHQTGQASSLLTIPRGGLQWVARVLTTSMEWPQLKAASCRPTTLRVKLETGRVIMALYEV